MLESPPTPGFSASLTGRHVVQHHQVMQESGSSLAMEEWFQVPVQCFIEREVMMEESILTVLVVLCLLLGSIAVLFQMLLVSCSGPVLLSVSHNCYQILTLSPNITMKLKA